MLAADSKNHADDSIPISAYISFIQSTVTSWLHLYKARHGTMLRLLLTRYACRISERCILPLLPLFRRAISLYHSNNWPPRLPYVPAIKAVREVIELTLQRVCVESVQRWLLWKLLWKRCQAPSFIPQPSQGQARGPTVQPLAHIYSESHTQLHLYKSMACCL